jgi:hypothetical protein
VQVLLEVDVVEEGLALVAAPSPMPPVTPWVIRLLAGSTVEAQ